MHLSVCGRELAGAGYGAGGKLYSGATFLLPQPLCSLLQLQPELLS